MKATCKAATSQGRYGVVVCGRPADYIAYPFDGEFRYVKVPMCYEHVPIPADPTYEPQPEFIGAPDAT